MHVLNSSSSNLNQDDTDITMINHSLLYGGNDEPISSCIPIVRRVQQANQSKSRTNSDDRQDYNYVNQELLSTAQQIEQILNYYRQDLKQESNTQLDCNRQLITRLIDCIRPVYSSNTNQMKDLDKLSTDISDLHDKRFFDDKEKNEQLNQKIRHLKKSIITTPVDNEDRNSLMTNLYRMNSMFDYEQWIEMEEETKKLQDLVITQREQIDQLIEILSQTGHTPINNRLNTHSCLLELTTDEQSLPIIHSMDLPIQQVAVNKIPNCSVCNYEFPIIFSELQISNHLEKCLSASVIVESKQSECPYCNEKLPNNDNTSYIQHLSQCFNELTGSF